MIIWDVQQAFMHSITCKTLLDDGWEPFAVTQDPEGSATIWLRKQRERIPMARMPYEREGRARARVALTEA